MPNRGAATVEHVGLSLLIALLALAAIAALAAGPADERARARLDPGAEAALRRRRPRALLARPADRGLRAARWPARCGRWRRRRAPRPGAVGRAAAAGRLPPLPLGELRAARRAPGADRVEPARDRVRRGRRPPRRRRPGRDHLLALPADARLGAGRRGWRRAADVAAARGTPLLETAGAGAGLRSRRSPGANHYDFAPAEEPPWRWRGASRR